MERAIGERHVHQGKGQLQNGSQGTPVQAGLQLLVEIIASQNDWLLQILLIILTCICICLTFLMKRPLDYGREKALDKLINSH